MAGLNRDTPTPTALTVHGASRVLEVARSLTSTSTCA